MSEEYRLPIECPECGEWFERKISVIDPETAKLRERVADLEGELDEWRYKRNADYVEDLEKQLAEKDALLAKQAAATKWAKQEIDGELQFDDDDRPIHECEYNTNPERGACDFCQGYAALEEALAYEGKERGA